MTVLDSGRALVNGLHSLTRRIFKLPQRVQPIVDEYDVVWNGPYYIPRSGEWHPSAFKLYRGTLYLSLYLAPWWHGLAWRVGSESVEAERSLGSGGCAPDEQAWRQALEQIARRLRRAVRSPQAYNRQVQRHLPLSCRTGKIQRSLCWPKRARRPLPLREVRKFERVMRQGDRPDLVGEMTLTRYLGVVAIAYDAGFQELRGLSPLEKYKRRADGRHGGLIELPPEDSGAFSSWYHGRSWAGTHPWEIAFGNPHGILISPRYHLDGNRWSYSLSVHAEGWYPTAARMALALAAAQVRLEFHEWERVVKALSGMDDVEVGRGFRQISYEELRQVRPDALSAIRWDAVPAVEIIAPDQLERVQVQLEGEEPLASGAAVLGGARFRKRGGRLPRL